MTPDPSPSDITHIPAGHLTTDHLHVEVTLPVRLGGVFGPEARVTGILRRVSHGDVGTVVVLAATDHRSGAEYTTTVGSDVIVEVTW